MICNVSSLLLGLASWIVAGIMLGRRNSYPNRLSVLSFVFCLAALLCQFVEIYRLVVIDDLSALIDTSGARVFAAVVLTGVTLLLHIAAWLRGKRAAR